MLTPFGPAFALIELSSIALGYVTVDAMLKRAPVQLVESRPVSPGKYIVAVAGDTASVQEAYAAGLEIAEPLLIDKLLLPNVHPSIFGALDKSNELGDVEAVGVIETLSVASTISAADAAAKAADITLAEIRLAVGLGGKSFVVLTGDIANVEIALEAGEAQAQLTNQLVRGVKIPLMHEEVKAWVL